MEKTGILYICPTPIGNLEDITFRVVKTLKDVDLIACEDTRVTQKLLNNYEIKTKLTSYHKFSEKQKSEYIISLLKEGKNIALVSDAGTPLVSDPGKELINQAYSNEIKVVPLPGASAAITAYSASYTETAHFTFIGFLSKQKSEKENILLKYKETNIILYEAPSRLVKTLKEVQEILGSVNVTVARELTKIYEEIKFDNVENVISYYENKPPKGEIVIIIQAQQHNNEVDDVNLVEMINKLKKQKFSTKDISKIIATLTSASKSRIYKLCIDN